MQPVLAHTLDGKTVTGVDGGQIGSIYNVTIDLRTGDLKKLLVVPDTQQATAERPKYEMDEHGRYMIPVESVHAVRDCIIVR